MCPHIQKTQSGSHAIVVAETQKVATKVLALEKQKSLPRNIATRETTREERKQCQKVKEVHEGTGSQSQRSKIEKCSKDPVEIHNIKQGDGESTEEFVQRYKLECRDVKGAPKCMKISGFMHGITNPELIKRLHDNIPRSMNEIMRVTAGFLRGEVAASNLERKRSFPSWK
ncbi:hypothetical protein Tco_0821162 [Tanacetum coccineum]|uniref:Reverse transcriptase domain-containing protein n=1 Tax=Tanacetum coccineum TaxID=301880 RepID=A0ABQ5ACF6_9ASTR